MENQVSPNKNAASDEIDLGQLLHLIKSGFDKLFKNFLRLFVYLKKSIIKLVILGVVGVALGIGLGKITTKRLKTEVIVKPNLESRNYLYDVVNEIRTNVKTKDNTFFEEMGIDAENLKGFQVHIEPVEKQNEKSSTDDDIKYLELLEKFRGDDLIADVVRTEVLNKSTLNHRITFTYKDGESGPGIAAKLIDYINSNDYYKELVKINQENALSRIEKNEQLVQQIDKLVGNYSDKISSASQNSDGRIILEDEQQLDITSLLALKNSVIRDIEEKKMEIQTHKEVIRIINFGNPQEVEKSFFGKNIVLFPLLLIGLFFLIDFLKLLNRKSKELQL
ncbi:MAG: hypothetical protein AB3N14_07130 [Flavobacteriaceae bacterium]